MIIVSKHIVIICRNSIESLPPVLNTIFILADLGHKISIISSSIDEDVRKLLNSNYGVQFYLSGKIIRGKDLPTTFKNNLRFRLHAENKISELCLHADILWISGEGTALSLYKSKCCKTMKYVFSCHELYESFVFKWVIKYFMKNAVLNVVPEYNRALIYRHWFRLPQTPFVLPNKTTNLYSALEGLNIAHIDLNNIAKLTNEIKAKSQGKKILLYQGDISERRKLAIIVNVAKELSDEYYLVIMGSRNNYLKVLEDIWSGFCYVGYISAPFHLYITKIAHIGIVSYDFVNLNNIFCAPNKIFEFSMFGLPMLCNDVGGLTSTIGAAKAGICVDFSKNENIISGLRQIDDRYDYYSNRSLDFYDSINMHALHKDLIAKIENLSA